MWSAGWVAGKPCCEYEGTVQSDLNAPRNPILDRLGSYARLVRLDRPIGILLLLWPTLWALWIAGDGKPDWMVVGIFVAGTVLMRSAGCAINDWADRDFDPHVKRTRNRPLAARRISGAEALGVAAVLSLIAFVLILPLDRLVIELSFVALFLAASYPFTKRFFALPQAYLGIAFGFGIPMAFAALQGRVPALGWGMLVANILWTLAYDTEYAMVDRDDDAKIGIRTAALLFGRFDVAAVMLFHAGFLALMAWLGVAFGLSMPYFAGLAVAAVLCAWQFRMIRSRTRDGCFRAFLHNNWVGAAIFAGIVVDALI
ncbi:MAG: 4-hydroxybenzoate octaprenyltransferase [Burkholderiales bacterium]|nr:4-hydroxybenzoate octaprenyltransferase [Burkholderiales bacterium]